MDFVSASQADVRVRDRDNIIYNRTTSELPVAGLLATPYFKMLSRPILYNNDSQLQNVYRCRKKHNKDILFNIMV